MPYKNKEDAKNNGKKYRETHKKERAKYMREYREINPQKDYSLKYLYGITQQDYERMYYEQNGKCAICGKEKKLVVDHDHQTGRIRGLLCHRCNSHLGYINDSPDILLKTISYLGVS